MATIKKENIFHPRDVRDFLNKRGGKVDNVFASFARSTANLNKWAFYKPEDYPALFEMTDNDRRLNNHGLDTSIMNTATQPSVLMDKAIAGVDFYPYILPKGDVDSPYRIADIRGYNPDAPSPYYFDAPEHFGVQEFPTDLYCRISLNSSAEFTLEDLASFEGIGGEKHIGVLWTNGDDSYHLYNPQEGNVHDGMEMNFKINKEGTYYLLPVYTDYTEEYGDVDVSGWADLFIPIPDTFRTVVVERIAVYGYVDISGFLEYDSLYLDQSNSVFGFSSYPKFTLTFPNGGTPSCTYIIGLYFTVNSDNGTYYGEWWHDGNDDYIYHGGGQDADEIQFVNFPTSISLADVFGEWDSQNAVNSIEIRLVLKRTEGQGYLTFSDSVTQIYNVVI